MNITCYCQQRVSNFKAVYPLTNPPKVCYPMERVGVLIKKLQEQLSQNASVENLLVTTQLLQSELVLQAKYAYGNTNSKVAIMVPNAVSIATSVNNIAPANQEVEQPVFTPFAPIVQEEVLETLAYKPVPKPEPDPEPVPQPIDEPTVPVEAPTPVPKPEPTPEPIPHFMEAKPWEELFPKGEKNARWALDTVMEVPTLAHQEKIVYELNDVMIGEEPASLNDKLKEQKSELGSVLQEVPIKDLKKAISINDRHRFIHELFRGDETMYERSIKTINGFHIYAEAEYWIQRELKVKLGWDTKLELVKTFDHLVKRRFA